MKTIHKYLFEVRGYELDSFGHVNHANYLHYCEQARWKILSHYGITLTTIQELKSWPVIAHFEAHYIKPSFLEDQMEVQTTHLESGRTYQVFQHEIYRHEKTGGELTLVFRGKVKVVSVNEDGRPMILSDRMKVLET